MQKLLLHTPVLERVIVCMCNITHTHTHDFFEEMHHTLSPSWAAICIPTSGRDSWRFALNFSRSYGERSYCLRGCANGRAFPPPSNPLFSCFLLNNLGASLAEFFVNLKELAIRTSAIAAYYHWSAIVVKWSNLPPGVNPNPTPWSSILRRGTATKVPGYSNSRN